MCVLFELPLPIANHSFCLSNVSVVKLQDILSLRVDLNDDAKKKVMLIPTKILHSYFRNSPDDRYVKSNCVVLFSGGVRIKTGAILSRH